MADVNLYLEEPKKVIGEYTDFFAGQLPTANDFNRWLAVLIAQGDYNTEWLDLIAQSVELSIDKIYTELNTLNEIVTPGSGGTILETVAEVASMMGGWRTYSSVYAVDASITRDYTIKEIIPLMDSKSILRLHREDITITDMENDSYVSYIEIIKYSDSIAVIKGFSTGDYVNADEAGEYFATYRETTGSCNGFYKLLDSNDPLYCGYTSVTQLGLTPETATLEELWWAMPNNTQAILDSSLLPAITMPPGAGVGTINIVKLNYMRQAQIQFTPRDKDAPWIMCLSTTGHQPSGWWVQLANNAEITIQLSTTGWVPVTGGYKQTKTLLGAKSTSNPDWCLKPASSTGFPTAEEKINDALVENVTFGTDTITFLASAVPTIVLTYRVKGVMP